MKRSKLRWLTVECCLEQLSRSSITTYTLQAVMINLKLCTTTISHHHHRSRRGHSTLQWTLKGWGLWFQPTKRGGLLTDLQVQPKLDLVPRNNINKDINFPITQCTHHLLHNINNNFFRRMGTCNIIPHTLLIIRACRPSPRPTPNRILLQVPSNISSILYHQAQPLHPMEEHPQVQHHRDQHHQRLPHLQHLPNLHHRRSTLEVPRLAVVDSETEYSHLDEEVQDLSESRRR